MYYLDIFFCDYLIGDICLLIILDVEKIPQHFSICKHSVHLEIFVFFQVEIDLQEYRQSDFGSKHKGILNNFEIIPQDSKVIMALFSKCQ